MGKRDKYEPNVAHMGVHFFIAHVAYCLNRPTNSKHLEQRGKDCMNNFAIKIYSISVRYDGFAHIFLFSTDSFENEKSAYGKNDFICKIVS